MYLVLLETSGNQKFIFATNRLRENIGASQLVYLAGTRFVLEAVREAGGPGLWDPNPARLREKLEKENPPVERDGSGIEVLLATSGKAMILAREEAAARRVVRGATLRALREAPGLECTGVVVGLDWDGKESLDEAIAQAHQDLERKTPARGAGLARFLRNPLAAPCSSSGKPASGRGVVGGETQLFSRECLAKREVAEESWKRIRLIAGPNARLAAGIDELEKRYPDLEWLGVLHGDGNGLGAIFLNFRRHSGAASNRELADRLRRFSLGLERCAEEAFRKAASGTENLVPLILGGDDLTLLGEASEVFDFARKYLAAFEESTRSDEVISSIARRALGDGRLSVSAGLAVVKPHFPFHAAYDLAEDLLRSAKQVKEKVRRNGGPWPCSALDFHIVLDASVGRLEEIRRRLRIGDRVNLTSRPYVAWKEPDPQAGVQGVEWGRAHSLEALLSRARAIREGRRGDPPPLPNSQLHYLRESLFLGREVSDARLKLIFSRYDKLKDLVEGSDPPSLFRESEGGFETRFLDALDAADLLRAQA